MKSGNAERMRYWNGEMVLAQGTLSTFRQMLPQLDLSADAFQKINRALNDATASEHRFTDQMREQNDASKKATQNLKNLEQQALRWIGTMVVMRGMRSLWRNMTEYAAEYYDQMNEIRIVTEKDEEWADQLGRRYRELASEMKVSSTEIASAAITFFRQGLDETQVEDRLRATTMYAKVAGVEFSEAAE